MSGDELTVVTPQGATECPQGQSVVITGLAFDATIECLKAGIAANDLWVLAEIDPQMLLRKGGFAIPRTRQILFFHPRFMARLLAGAAAAIVEAPLKFVVVETGEGVVVRWPDPEYSFARYPALAALGSELTAAVARITSTLPAAAIAA